MAVLEPSQDSIDCLFHSLCKYPNTFCFYLFCSINKFVSFKKYYHWGSVVAILLETFSPGNPFIGISLIKRRLILASLLIVRHLKQSWKVIHWDQGFSSYESSCTSWDACPELRNQVLHLHLNLWYDVLRDLSYPFILNRTLFNMGKSYLFFHSVNLLVKIFFLALFMVNEAIKLFNFMVE